MKPSSVALTLVALLATIPIAHARLGDTESELVQRYGKPKLVQLTTGDIPMQKGYYAELKENFNTNVSLIASTDKGYNEIGYGMDLVETRTRYTFEKDGIRRLVYLGNTNETYDGVDFAGKSAREVINAPIVWVKDKHGDKIGQPVPLSPSAINTILEDNKGNATWADAWQPIAVPGTFIKRTTDKSRLAIAYGASPTEIYRLELRMVDDTGKATD